jgi:hypothetical protein
LLAFVVPYYLLIGTFQVKFARYTLPLYPPLCIWTGRALAEWGGWRAPVRNRGVALAGRAAVALVGLYTLCYAFAVDGVMAGTDNRDAAAAWLAPRMTVGTTVALAAPLWFYTPPLTPTIGLTHVMAGIGTPPRFPKKVRLMTPDDGSLLTPAELAAHRPRYVVVTQFQEDDLRAARAVGKEFPMVALQRALDRDYQPGGIFASLPRLGPFAWFTHKPPPQDMMYIMPRVRVYERKAGV